MHCGVQNQAEWPCFSSIFFKKDKKAYRKVRKTEGVFKSEKLGVGETMGLAPWSLGEHIGWVIRVKSTWSCLWLQDRISVRITASVCVDAAEMSSSHPRFGIFSRLGWRDQGLTEIYFLYEKRMRGKKVKSHSFYQIVTTDYNSTFCLGCQEAPS